MDEIMLAAAILAAKVVGEQVLGFVVGRLFAAKAEASGTVLRLTVGGAGLLLQLERTTP